MAVCEARAARGAEKSALTQRIAVTLKVAKSVSCDGQAPGAVDAAPVSLIASSLLPSLCDRLIVAACRAYEVLISRCAKLRPDAHLTGDPA